jgi:RHS repeat-associated protein
VYFGGKRTARIDLPANTVHYYLSDHLNSTSQVVSSSGVIEEESDYSPFGTEVIVTGPGANHYKFTGKERDSESGLDYFGARYYSNGLGRFITPDWSAIPVPVPYADLSDPQSLNQYTYVRNIPTTNVDADGHCPWCPAVERILEEAAETPEGRVIVENAGKAIGGIGGGIAVGWAATSGFAEKAWNSYVDAAGSSGGAGGNMGTLGMTNARLNADAAVSKDAPADPNKPGTLGKPDHQATVKEEAEKLGGRPEVTIKTPGGSKDSRRADAAETDANGNYKPGGKIVQVIRPTPAGNVPKREQQAAQDLQNATGVKPELVPVRPLPKKEDK